MFHIKKKPPKNYRLFLHWFIFRGEKKHEIMLCVHVHDFLLSLANLLAHDNSKLMQNAIISAS